MKRDLREDSEQLMEQDFGKDKIWRKGTGWSSIDFFFFPPTSEEIKDGGRYLERRIGRYFQEFSQSPFETTRVR